MTEEEEVRKADKEVRRAALLKNEAEKAYDKANIARNKAGKVYNEADKVYLEAEKAYCKAIKVHNEAEKVYFKTRYTLQENDLVLGRCPVCTGTGLVLKGFYGIHTSIATTAVIEQEECRSCYGRGWINPKEFIEVENKLLARLGYQVKTKFEIDERVLSKAEKEVE